MSTYVILSPADYHNILAELQSPAALHSDPHFLEPDFPVTPNLSQSHHQHHLDLDTNTPLLADSQPQPLPWSPEIQPDSGDTDGPPRSPPRPCELSLSIPAFELPDPIPTKVRKPHIALNDQLLLSEEEDKSCQEMEPSCKPKSPSLPAMCELGIDMAFSISSPSLSSVPSVTPSTPDKAQIGSEEAKMGVPDRVQEDVELKEGKKEVTTEREKVAEMVVAEVAEGNGLVEKWVEQDLIKNVERKCEMIIKDRSKCKGENNILLEQREGSSEKQMLVLMQGGIKGAACEVEEERDRQHDLIEFGHELENNNKKAQNVEDCIDKNVEVRRLDESSQGRVYQRDRMEGTDEKLQLKSGEGLSDRQGDICRTSDADIVADNRAVAWVSPQAWVEALLECNQSDSGSNEEEEEAEQAKELTEEPLGTLLEVMEKGKGSEEEKKEVTNASVEETLVQVEQTEKEVCSLVGWHNDSSSVNVEPPTPGRCVSSDLLERRER